jgi:hypothetical protein
MGLAQLGALGWGLLALVVIPLLQLPLVLYLSRRVETDGETPLGHAAEFHADPEEPSGDFEHDTETVRGSRSRNARVADSSADPSPATPSRVACPACGTENDPAFDYCRGCVGRLSGARSASASPPSRGSE